MIDIIHEQYIKVTFKFLECKVRAIQLQISESTILTLPSVTPMWTLLTLSSLSLSVVSEGQFFLFLKLPLSSPLCPLELSRVVEPSLSFGGMML